MREVTEPHGPETDRWRAALRIAGAILIAAVLAGCDRCGDLAFPGTTTCRQEAPKPH